MALDVGRLRVLVEVAHAGSIAAAARRMGFSPSALSQQLAKLERQVGARLLERGAGGVTPTATGQVLVEHGERVLGELREAERAVATAGTAGAATVTIALGTFATGGTLLVPAALAALRRDHPQVRLALRDVEPPDGYGLVASGDLDVLITHRYPGMPSTPVRGLVRRNLLLDPLRVVVPTAWADEVTHPLDDASWVCGPPGSPSRVCLEHLARAAGTASPRVDLETADYALTLALVRDGLGVALVPASVLAGSPVDGVAVRDVAGTPPVREICAVHRRRPPPPAQRLIDLVQQAAVRLAARLAAGSGAGERDLTGG